MITNVTVVTNLAIIKEEPTVSMASSSAVKTEVKTEVKALTYTHKLKRAWVQTYNNCNNEPNAKKVTPNALGYSDYLAPCTSKNTTDMPLPIVPIYASPKTSMDEVLTRFPHVGEQIFANLDDQNLAKCREVCDPWMTFLDNEKLIWIRIIMSHIEATNSWNWQKFFSSTSISMVCKIAIRMQHFYKFECTSGIVKEMSPLHFAVMMYDDTKYCVNLIENGTMEHPKNENETTPLHYSAKYGYIGVCQLLLEHFSDENPKNKADKTPLELAIQFNNYFVCELIIRKCEAKNPMVVRPGAAITPVSFKRPWISTFPTIFSDLSTILNPLNKDGFTPLHLAAINGRKDLCQLIMKNLADKNPESTQNVPLFGLTPLHLAAREGHFSICELILKNVGNKNPYDKLRRSPLNMAARRGHLSICHLLYENSPDITDHDLCLMLEAAVYGGHYDVCKFFVQKIGCKVLEYVDLSLCAAAATGNLKICKLLIENLQINRRTEHNYDTPLHAAAKQGHFDIYKLIMKGFRDKNPKDYTGNTPLHLAARIGHFNLCELIILNVVNKNPINLRYETPMYVAAISNHVAVCDFLEKSVRNCKVKSSLETENYYNSDLPDSATEPSHHNMLLDYSQ